MAAQVEVHDLEVTSQRLEHGLHRHVVQAGAAVDGHQDRALHRRVSPRDDDEQRRQGKWTIIVEAVSHGGRAIRGEVEGVDGYGTTAAGHGVRWRVFEA